MKTYSFIDASNLFYGGEKSLGWKVDYQKLLKYLEKKYNVEKFFYFGGVEISNFSHNYLENNYIFIDDIKEYFIDLLENNKLNNKKKDLFKKYLSRVKFYKKLDKFGYNLFLKPVKLYKNENGCTKRKANCDVDMTFHLMKEKDNFDRVIILSGDGDFLPVLKYLREIRKEVFILSRRSRTAKEIKQFAGVDFKDFEYLKNRIRLK